MRTITELIRNTYSTAIKAIKIGSISLVTAQMLAGGTLAAVDMLRKFRSTDTPEGYPILEPEQIRVGDNTLTPYMEGYSLYRDMLDAIDNAQYFVCFETFIWKNDAVGRLFKKALIRAAKRGVEVYIIWDTFGNLVVNPFFFSFPRHRRLHPLRYPLPHSGRDHRKILVVDGDVGFVGGYNIGDIYASEEWRDTHVQVEGPAVWELQNAFVDFWNRARGRRFGSLIDDVLKPVVGKPERLPQLPDLGAKKWDAEIAAAINDPKRLLFPVRGSYIDALERATTNAYITAAYFIPDSEIKGAMIAALKRGVDVKILVPEKSNHVVADWIGRAYITELLRAGVELWVYEDVMIHSKTAVVDGRWATVGTANIDRMSMTGNHEINLQIVDSDFAKRMEDIFHTDLQNSRRITLEEWQQRPLFARIVERILKPLGVLV